MCNMMNEKVDVTDLVNLTQAAKYLDVSYMTIHRWRKEGKFKVVVIGGFPYVSLGDLVKIKEGNNNAEN